MIDATLGFRVHTGWAAMVVLGAAGDDRVVLDRRRVELIDHQRVDGAVFHAAQAVGLDRARDLVAAVTTAAEDGAATAIASAVDAAASGGHRVVAAGVLVGMAAIPDDLAAILRSHALLHAAEGALYRDALVAGLAHHGLPVVAVPDREVEREAARVLETDADGVVAHVARLGRGIGAPWAQEQKRAALVAWIASILGEAPSG